MELTGEVARAATVAAGAAAARAGVATRELLTRAEVTAAGAVLDAVWAAHDGPVVPPELLVALVEAGCQVSGAYSGARMVGVTVALLAADRGAGYAGPSPPVHLHSHVTAVLDGYQGRGLGWALKQHQRAWALTRGIGHVRWTFDPLVRRNAVLNLVKLGARPVRFAADLYGRMGDVRNAGLPTHRVVVDWDLTAPRVAAAADGRFFEPQLDGLRRAGAVEILRSGADDVPVAAGELTAPRLLAQVPPDIEGLRAGRPDVAAAWSDAIAATLGRALDGGHRVTGMTRDGWYVLAGGEGVEELR